MWCDNCLLLLPLRAGSIAWNAAIFIYSIVGGIFFFLWGPYFFFIYPEWQIYGGIAMAIGAVALINVIALSNKSYIWTRVCKFLWPLIVVISAVRDIIIIVELQRGKDKINWECDNDSTIYPDNVNYTTYSLPSCFCNVGYSSIDTAWIIAVLVDLCFQFYAMFLNWRFSKRLEHYSGMKGPFYGGYYNA
ncbi:uncharacterized protein STEHIDRAFT_89915 [Stereum hirsutum FP-91666 SS1]|uniref:uncharacterized protein n=1 Tax=Stereum hirsutum (strain FP-91666) TaxID=721885 RepID=UPI000440BFB3|nr:uncharacterized protein STEHIDRAFT_89915 [Stereum hirsutum FP-91666 SS1]EIM92697.1 hypothetical protein STEHIDRAFT_89915 [Stereum hirsutum FP-91666 SS1]